MARNPIQFGKGLSLSDFQELYGTEEQCRQAVVGWRWPKGFVCPACGGRDHAIVGKRRLYLCHGCRKQTSVIAGTVFENSLLPLTKWFSARQCPHNNCSFVRAVPRPSGQNCNVGETDLCRLAAGRADQVASDYPWRWSNHCLCCGCNSWRDRAVQERPRLCSLDRSDSLEQIKRG
jgi:Transposase zinc-ribbon domain